MELAEVKNPDTRFKTKSQRLLIPPTNDFIELKSAFKGILKTYYYKNESEQYKDICLLMIAIKSKIKTILVNHLEQFGALKFNLLVECTYIRHFTEELQSRAFKTSNTTLYYGSLIDVILRKLVKKICYEEDESLAKGSGWSLHTVDGILLRISRFKPLGGSSHIPLPKDIQSKHAIINPLNCNDDECFKWAILSRYIKGPHPERINKRYTAIESKIDFACIDYPTSLKDIKKFEKFNPNISVNVYGLKKKKCSLSFKNLQTSKN